MEVGNILLFLLSDLLKTYTLRNTKKCSRREEITSGKHYVLAIIDYYRDYVLAIVDCYIRYMPGIFDCYDRYVQASLTSYRRHVRTFLKLINFPIDILH